MLYGPNTNQGGNSIVYVLEAGARLVAGAVSRVARRGGYLEVRPEVEKPVQPTTLGGPGKDHLDAVRQLLPLALRPHRHPVALHRTRVRPPDLAATVAGLDAPGRRKPCRSVERSVKR